MSGVCVVWAKYVVPEKEIEAPEDQGFHDSGFLQALSGFTHLA
jgi:hypothetical protein